MANRALAAVMSKSGGGPRKPPPRFADEGEPEESGERGGAEGEEPDEAEAAADAEGAPEEAGGGGYDEHFQMAADNIADALGVANEDRVDFANNLKTAIHACLGDALAEHAGGGDAAPEEGEGPPEE